MFLGLVEGLSRWAIPLMMLAILLYGWIRGVRVYEAFVEGAQEGFWVAVRILPYIVAIFVALGVFRVSGSLEGIVSWIRPLVALVGMPPEVLPLMIMRPLSGGAALGILGDLLSVHGADSFIGRLASTMQGSTDTTLYIISVYFGSVGIKKTRHALAAGLAGDLAGFVGALFICRRVFG